MASFPTVPYHVSYSSVSYSREFISTSMGTGRPVRMESGGMRL